MPRDPERKLADAVCRDSSVPISVRVAAKLALGRAMRAQIEPLHVSLVIAVYKEHHRILTAREHVDGEDFLRERLRQLRWLFRSTPRHTWDLAVVDDGCPEGSGRIARSILDEFAEPPEEVSVLFRLLPQLRGIVDTQCGFKAFDARQLRTWIEDVGEDGFSFDIEMLVRIRLSGAGFVRKVPLAWIDSEAASTTAGFGLTNQNSAQIVIDRGARVDRDGSAATPTVRGAVGPPGPNPRSCRPRSLSNA